MDKRMRRLIHTAILAVVVMMFSITVEQALAELTAAQESATLAFLQVFPNNFQALRESWTGTDFCTWDGVTCDTTANEVSINLSGRDLTGDMPEVDSGLTHTDIMVTSIDMSNNPHWNDQFEQTWGQLTNLKVLDLRNTALHGTIPDDWNGMTSLEEVYISNTYSCERLPNWSMTTLRILDLSYNNMRNSLPDSWSSMTALTSVNIMGNNVCGCVPTTWTSPVLLEAAAAIGNGVSDANCATANSCDNRNSHCIQYDASIAGLTLKQRHTLSFLNRFPNALPYLRERWTGVDYCSWEGITCDAAGIVAIDLSNKGLTGDMPQMNSNTDGWLVQVTSIDMSSNLEWRDDFEDNWGNLKNLVFLNLSHTALKDDIPSDWNGMTSLEEVHITNTGACKSLPDWTLAKLRVADFSNNNLHGTLSPTWSQMSSLTSVNFAGNEFCGCVPSTWTAALLADAVSGMNVAGDACSTSNQCTFADLRCWASTVTTGAPAATASATLAFLREFTRKFTYVRTRWTGDNYCSWEGITCDAAGYVSVDLSDKGLVGYMPDVRNGVDGSQVLVVTIDMSSNPGVSGNFPNSWAALGQLRSLDLSNTSLYGNIPDAWNGMASLETVHISNTYACRSLPNWNMASLRTVQFMHNNMYGSLAPSWSAMTNLNSLDITGNEFCGCVPETWTSAVLTNAAAAVGSNLTATDCAVANACTANSFRCRNAAAVPVQAVVAVATVLVALLAALAL